MKKSFISFILIFSVATHASQDNIKEALKNILPDGAVIELIEPSPIPGMYAVYYGDLQPIYVTQDGSFFIYGDIYKINHDYISNITEQSVAERRKVILNEIPKEELISFKSTTEKFSVVVFTDVDCGYCRKFHNEIKDFNDLGITVNYVAFPRSGLDSVSYNKIVTAWCSKDPKSVLTKMKQGIDVELSMCQDHPVEAHFLLGQKIGITGTPAIIKSNGELLPGYLPPEELLTRLN